MEAVILAGGKGTRLRPYTASLPKPLVPIGDMPIIEILLRQFASAGVTRAHLAVNHLASLIQAVVGDGSRLGLEIEYSIEDEPLSTVAPVKRIENLPETFIVANGDVLTDLNVSDLYKAHLESGARLTVATYPRKEKIDFGVLEVDAESAITGFSEKPLYQFDVSMGVYVFSRSLLELVPDTGAFGFDELMLLLLKRGEYIRAYRYDGYWLNINRPDDYEKAQDEVDIIKGWL